MRVIAPAYWTFVYLTLTFPVTLPLVAVGFVAWRGRGGEALREWDVPARWLLLPSAFTVALWLWAAMFGRPESDAVAATFMQSGWRGLGILALLVLQASIVIALPFRVPAGRLTALVYGIVQLWCGVMAGLVAAYAVSGRPIPVL